MIYDFMSMNAQKFYGLLTKTKLNDLINHDFKYFYNSILNLKKIQFIFNFFVIVSILSQYF